MNIFPVTSPGLLTLHRLMQAPEVEAAHSRQLVLLGTQMRNNGWDNYLFETKYRKDLTSASRSGVLQATDGHCDVRLTYLANCTRNGQLDLELHLMTRPYLASRRHELTDFHLMGSLTKPVADLCAVLDDPEQTDVRAMTNAGVAIFQLNRFFEDTAMVEPAWLRWLGTRLEP